MPKTSPIYNLIIELQHENHDITKKFMLITNTLRNYFLFKLSTNIQSILDEDYILEEAHFSIDEAYNYSQHGYTPIHYTQSYFSKTKNQYLVIHGFLDAQGNYLYSQAKELNEQKIFTGTYLDLTSSQETILKNQINECIPLLMPLFTEKTTREKQLQNKSDYLDWELTNLSQDLHSQKAHQEYIQKAHEFIKIIQKLNQYRETRDARNLLMLHMIHQIQKIDTCMQRGQRREILDSEPMQKDFEIKAEIVESLESIDELYKDAIVKFSQIIEAFQACDLDLLKEKHQLASNLHEQLFIIYYFPESMITKQDKLKIKKALDHTNKFYQNQVKGLTEKALKGDITAIEQSFPLCSRYITTDFYEALANSLLEKKWDMLSERILKICDYLSENDERYRNYIFNISQEKIFSVPKKIIFDLIKSKNPQIENSTYEFSNYNASLLFQLYLKNKKDLFKTFLHHGASYNTWGIKSYGKNHISFALFYSITIAQTTDYLDYLKILLEYQVDTDAIFTQEETKNTNLEKLKNAIGEMKSSKKIPYTQVKTQCFVAPLQILSRIENLEADNLGFFTKILQRSALHNLAFSLTCFYLDPLTRRRISLANHFSLQYVNNENEAQAQVISQSKQSNNECFPYYIFYPEFNSTPQAIQKLHSIYKKMTLIEKTIIQKISNLNQEKFEEQYRIAFKIAENEFIRAKHFNFKNEFQLIFNYFIGCEYLLMSYTDRFISVSNQRDFIEKYSTPLYTSIIEIVKAMYTPQEATSRIQLYKKIRESFIKKHTVPDLPKMIVTQFEKLIPGMPAVRFSRVNTDLNAPISRLFLIDHYKFVPVYTEAEFNKPKNTIK